MRLRPYNETEDVRISYRDTVALQDEKDGVVRLGWCGIHMQAEALVLQPDTTPPQANHIVTPTHIEPEQYNT